MTDAERAEFIRYINDQYDLLICKIVNEILPEYELVDDVKQQVLIRLMEKAELLATLHPRQVTAYVGTAAKNCAIDEYRKIKLREEKQGRAVEEQQKYMTMDFVDFSAFQVKYGFGEELWSLLLDLPKMDRELMVYKFYYRMTNEEISRAFGTNQEQVKKRYQRAKKKLKLMIEERKGEGA